MDGCWRRSDFLPYVFDNNESFSGLWHAHNRYHFDIRQSAGLPDEASSPHPEAYPFVHTHQGNMLRLFAFVLYVLGARSVETQIAVTTLLIGPLVSALAFRLFWRLAGPLFATITCLVLLTDDFFVAQWIVVACRIWHFVFVFGAVLCAYELGGSRPIRWGLGLLTLFVLIFYYEPVFAGFVTVFTGLFALWRHWRRPARLALIWTLQVLGAVIGVGTLALQLSLHFGPDVTLYLTPGMRGRKRVVIIQSTAAVAGPRHDSARFVIGRDPNVDPCRGKTVRPEQPAVSVSALAPDSVAIFVPVAPSPLRLVRLSGPSSGVMALIVAFPFSVDLSSRCVEAAPDSAHEAATPTVSRWRKS